MIRQLYRILASTALTFTAGCGSFTGKVIDQYGEPVPKAEVCVSYTTPSLAGCIVPFLPDWGSVVHHDWRTTRENGTFRVMGLHGYNWTITGAHGARKTGYEYQYPVEHNPTNDFFLIRMRKRLNPCFLHHSPYARYGFKAPGETVALDFIQDEAVQIDPPKKRANSGWPLPALTYDLIIDARFDSANKTWNVVIRPQPDDYGGIIAANEKVYEAPLEGYTNLLSFSIPVSRQAGIGPKCLVVRSRNPEVYTRLDVTHVMANEEYLGLSFDRYTNPYGNRSLDIDPRVEKNYEVRKGLIEASKAAWQKGHPPAKPDFRVLLQSVNEFGD